LDLAKLRDRSNVPLINNPDVVPRRNALPPAAEQEVIAEVLEDQLSIIDHMAADFGTQEFRISYESANVPSPNFQNADWY
jgi:hypothetical protein